MSRMRTKSHAAKGCGLRSSIRESTSLTRILRIESQTREFTVVAETDVRTAEQFNNIIIANVGGYPVRIRDVGNAEVGPVEERVISRFNGKPSLNIGVIKQAVPTSSARSARRSCSSCS